MIEHGIATSTAKALSHLMLIFTGITEESWAMTRAMALVEAEEAVEHVNRIRTEFLDLLTTPTAHAIGAWLQDVTYIRDALRDLPDQSALLSPEDCGTYDLRAAISGAWNITASLDAEMLGINNAAPGTAP